MNANQKYGNYGERLVYNDRWTIKMDEVCGKEDAGDFAKVLTV